MNRRDFLKNASACIAFAALPPVVASPGDPPPGYTRVPGYSRFHQFDGARQYREPYEPLPEGTPNYWKDFDPAIQYGNVIAMSHQPSPEAEAKMCKALWENMNQYIPSLYREWVYIHGAKFDFGRGFQLAWKYDPTVIPA